MKYKVGDKVRVKSWEEMEKEYGLYKNGDIKTKANFAKSMKFLCNKIVTIKKVIPEYYSIKEDTERFAWSDDMFEPLEKRFIKDELKTGMLVELRNGEKYKVLKDYETFICGKGMISNKSGFIPLLNFSKNLNNSFGVKYDIIKIYKPKGDCYFFNYNMQNFELIWEREQTRKMTLAEIEKELGYSIEIVEG